MTTRILAVLGLIALTATVSHARPKFSVQGIFGVNGEAEAEIGNFDSKEDIDSNLGLAATVEWKINRKSPLRVGLRLAYQSIDVEDNAGDSSTSATDIGAWGRYIFLPGKFELFGAAGVSYSLLDFDPEGSGGDAEGAGFNILAGAGATFPVNKRMRVIGGIYFSRHSGTLEGDNDVEVDVVMQQVQLMAGVTF
jgi:long-subunit fatty acid transport protein